MDEDLGVLLDICRFIGNQFNDRGKEWKNEDLSVSWVEDRVGSWYHSYPSKTLWYR